jgi:carbamate kinase
MDNAKLVVVALGGNAISREHEEGNVDQQFANSQSTAYQLADIVASGHQLVITHGNGPQIGNFLLRNEAAAKSIYPLPMEVAVAHVQGGMGFMIALTLQNELQRRGMDRTVTPIVTTIKVDADDRSFQNPTKPIGRIFTPEEAKQRSHDFGWSVKEISPGKFRRVVASPRPRKIMELPTIKRAVEAGELLVTCGGGGIPIVGSARTGHRGTAAVIDKDLATALLAAELGARTMIILTAVDRVRINFGKPDEQPIDRMTVAQAKQWLGEGQFPAGSMGPKVQGAIEFLEAVNDPDARAVIGPLDHASDALEGKTGTTITLR